MKPKDIRGRAGARVIQACFPERKIPLGVPTQRFMRGEMPPHPGTVAVAQRRVGSVQGGGMPPHPAMVARQTAVQRGPDRRPVVQRKDEVHAFAPPRGLLERSGPGQPLAAEVRHEMERYFDADFSEVRVHVGSEAKSIGALAFTAGSDIYFAPEHYRPGTRAGHELLGHELTHVVQQREGRVPNPLRDRVAVVQDFELEAEADWHGVLAAQGRMGPKARGGSSAGLPRKLGSVQAKRGGDGSRLGNIGGVDGQNIQERTGTRKSSHKGPVQAKLANSSPNAPAAILRRSPLLDSRVEAPTLIVQRKLSDAKLMRTLTYDTVARLSPIEWERLLYWNNEDAFGDDQSPKSRKYILGHTSQSHPNEQEHQEVDRGIRDIGWWERYDGFGVTLPLALGGHKLRFIKNSAYIVFNGTAWISTNAIWRGDPRDPRSDPKYMIHVILNWASSGIGDPAPHLTVRLRAYQERMIAVAGYQSLGELDATKSSYSVGLGNSRNEGDLLGLTDEEKECLDRQSVKDWLRYTVVPAAREAERS